MFSKQQVHVLLILWRDGVNSRHRHCWRFALTDAGREAISELFGKTETTRHIDISLIVRR